MVLDRIDALEKAVHELTMRVNSLHEVQKQVAAEQKEAEATAKAQAKDAAAAEAERAKREHPPAADFHPAKGHSTGEQSHPAKGRKHK